METTPLVVFDSIFLKKIIFIFIKVLDLHCYRYFGIVVFKIKNKYPAVLLEVCEFVSVWLCLWFYWRCYIWALYFRNDIFYTLLFPFLSHKSVYVKVNYQNVKSNVLYFPLPNCFCVTTTTTTIIIMIIVSKDYYYFSLCMHINVSKVDIFNIIQR